MSANTIRDQVKDFKEQYAYGEDPEDCFAPWYLTQVCGLAPSEAIRFSAESKKGFNGPGNDRGIDAFYLKREENKPTTLVLIQAKFTGDLNQITKGVRDFKKGIKWLKYALHSSEAEYEKENKVLVNLRSELSALSGDEKSKIKLEFVVIHLNENEIDIINNRTRDAQEDLKEELRDELPDFIYKIRVEGPRLIENAPPPEILPSPQISIEFDGTIISVDGHIEAEMFQGIGKLSELVDLYRTRKDDLFSKNVRLFITSKKNVEKGPSGKIRETLKSICVDKIQSQPPELFALYHNGITIHARDAHYDHEARKISFRDPYVLNGCQTITTAYRFRHGQKISNQIDEVLWKQIAIPIRIIHTKNEPLVRTITVSNNRQNAITAAALRANDPVQIEIEHRLGEVGVFYERQEGAFDYLEDTDPNRLNRVYRNSTWGPVNISDLARSLAATAGEINIAMNVTDLFESDNAYGKCFSQKRLASAHLLIFMQNVHDTLGVVLRNDLGLDWGESYVKTGKVFYFVYCLLMRYLAKNGLDDIVAEYGSLIWARDRQLRDEITKQLDNRHSGIKGQIKERFMTLDDTKMENITGAFKRIENNLRLGDAVDVFSAFSDLDKRFDD